MAHEVLTALKDHEQAWTRAEAILRISSNPETKYIALQMLESLIETRWKLLTREKCEEMRAYIVGLIIKTSSDSNCAQREKVYLGKLNAILVLILKQEWLNYWPNFIPEIVEASTTKFNDSLAQNNMLILKLLSEEVSNFCSGNITEIKAKHLKNTMCNEFSLVFQLCVYFLVSRKHISVLTYLVFKESILCVITESIMSPRIKVFTFYLFFRTIRIMLNWFAPPSKPFSDSSVGFRKDISSKQNSLRY